MNSFLQNKCAKMIIKYQQTNDQELRNQIYDLLMMHILKMTKNAMKKRKRHKSIQELLSYTWEIFSEFMKVYDIQYPLMKHLSLCTESFISKKFQEDYKITKRLISITTDEESGINCDDNLDYMAMSEGVNYTNFIDYTIDLKLFRDILSEDYRLVFDDALASRGAGVLQALNRIKESKFPPYRYYEAKRVFIILINYFLKK